MPVILYLVLSFDYLLLIPIGESPDEPGHIQCLEQVAIANRLPRVEPPPQGERWFSRGRIISGRMCYHMPLYYVLGGWVERATAVLTGTPLPYEFPANNPLFPGRSAAMFVPQTTRQPTPILALRLFSILLGLATLWATYILARRLFPESDMIAILAMLIVAGWPQLVFMSRAINNDVLATAFSVLLLGVLAANQRPQRFVLAAVLSALALLTKLTVFFTIGAVILIWLWEFITSPQQRSAYLRVLTVCLFIWFGVGLLLFLHPVLNEHLRNGTSRLTPLPETVRHLNYWNEVFVETLNSGWARFGWMNIFAPDWHAYLWWGLVAMMAGLGIRYITAVSSVRLLIFIWLIGVGLTYIRINLTIFQPQFRFAFATLPIIAALAAGGAWHTSQAHKHPWLPISLLSFFWLFYNIWLLLFVIKPVYQ